MRHVTLLLWLRWKYLWRATPARRFTMVLGALLALGLAALLAFLLYRLLRKGEDAGLDPAVFAQYHALGFAVLYLGWLYFASLSELYDPARLAPYPVRPITLFWGSCLSTVVGVTPIYAGGLWLGLTLGREAPAGTVAVRTALFVLFIAHLVMLSRLLRLTFLQFLTSRRWRDIAIVASALIGGGLFTLMQLFQRQIPGAWAWLRDAAERGDFTKWLGGVPSTWFARAYEADGTASIVAGAAFAGATALVAVLGGAVERKLAFSEPVFLYRPRAKATAGGPPRFLTGLVGRLGRLLGDDIAAVARKEMAVLGRDPSVRSMLLRNFFYVLVPIAFPIVQARQSAAASLGEIVGMAMLFYELFFFLNMFGTDGPALRALASTPVARGRIVAGKALCYAAVFLPLNVVMMSAAAFAFGTPALLARDLGHHVAGFLVLLGAGSVVSVWFPARIIAPGQRLNRVDTEQGCTALLFRTGAFFGVLALMGPVALGRAAVPLFGLGAAAEAAIVAGGIAYAAVVFAIGVALAGRSLQLREEKMVDAFVRA